LAKGRTLEVGKLLLGLCKTAQWDADAPAYLQDATAAYAKEYTGTFVKILKRLKRKEQDHVVTFLADVENHDAYPEYQGIIDHLKGLGDNDLVAKFEKARKKRKQQPHD